MYLHNTFSIRNNSTFHVQTSIKNIIFSKRDEKGQRYDLHLLSYRIWKKNNALFTIHIFLGCSGNQNNFLSRADCERKCSQHLKPVNLAQQKDPICSLPLKQGNCKAFKPRFYYNSQSQKCEKFIFGGCQGNENNFPTFRDCVKKCAEEQPSSQSSSRSASVLSSQTAIENPNLEIPPPQCVFNGTHKFNLGR